MVSSLKTCSPLSDVSITFRSAVNGSISVQISTKRLKLKSITQDDLQNYVKLYGDQQVMQKFATGKTLTQLEVAARIESAVKRWSAGVPFSGFAVFLKGTNDFIGHAVAGFGDDPGESEIAYLLHTAHWKKGYGTEIGQTLVNGYLPFLKDNGFKTQNTLVNKVKATSRVDNLGSQKILSAAGLIVKKTEEKFGALREHSEKDLFGIPAELIASYISDEIPVAKLDNAKKEIEETLTRVPETQQK
jgi:RimJ/RimL family protein N-acetyltransferase